MTIHRIPNEQEPTEAVFCIGSNCGDRKGNVESALKWISGLLDDFRHSTVYATPDCHGGQREYINAVAIGTTPLRPQELERLCKEHETDCGRTDSARAAGDVPVDIDIVIYGTDVLRDKDYRCEFFQKGYREIANHP